MNRKAYGQSKLANILFSNHLSQSILKYNTIYENITSNALHPGVIKTEIARHVTESAEGILKYIITAIFDAMDIVAMDLDSGAMTQLYVATSPKMHGVTGKFYEPIAREILPSKFAQDKDLQLKLWEVSEAMVINFAK
jgi:NAD(P)-dependent dehydrogenase (short-subunit alcohol dehydrogenase family)